MDDILALSRQPLKLLPTRVWRTYTGGRLIDEWHGYENPEDSEYPEEWVASLVTSRRPDLDAKTDEGLSQLQHGGRRVYLKDLVSRNLEAFLGKRHYEEFGPAAGVLVKVLDSAERLAIQVHPDKPLARRLFDSDYGKTEAWYIIGGRTIGSEPPYVLLGFKPGITREDWERLFEAQDIPKMVDALHKVYVKPGDVYLVEGGVPHAVGPGCFIIEIQEPTDYTIRTERRTPGGLDLPDGLIHQGLGFERMFDCFHYQGFERSELLAKYRLAAAASEAKGDFRETLISRKQTPAFSMDRLVVSSRLPIDTDQSFSSLIVVSGRGMLHYGGGSVDISQGDQLFIPNGVRGLECENTGDEPAVLVQCYPPVEKGVPG